jgi:tRNA threonylcarbamoyladenosine biosynthesis protein TsaB
MLILAIDTALDACAAGILDTDAAALIAQESQAMKRGHAEALMPLIGRVMKASGVGFAGLDRIAVTTGPGSFTGLRVGLSAARGIALASGKPVVGLTTLAAFAAPVVDRNAGRPVISAIDARHDHVYFQVVSGDGGALILPRVAPVEEALGRQRHRRRLRSMTGQRPTLPGWPGSGPRSIPKTRRPGPIICARPTPSHKKTCYRIPRSPPPHHDGMVFRPQEQ